MLTHEELIVKLLHTPLLQIKNEKRNTSLCSFMKSKQLFHTAHLPRANPVAVDPGGPKRPDNRPVPGVLAAAK